MSPDAALAGADEPPLVVIVAGPTASGKSALGLALAEAFGGTVINADSMQVYRELRILTARPGEADLARAPHRLYGAIPGAEPCSAGRWRDLALEAIDEALAGGRLPILVGGTGLYLRVLRDGLAPVPKIPKALRAEAADLLLAEGPGGLHRALAVLDPAMAARLHPNDSQRLTRAWEVVRATGRSLLEWQDDPQTQGPAPYRFMTVVLMPPREVLRDACDRRFLAMLEAGALDEAAALKNLELPPDCPVMKSLGVPDLLACLRGDQTLAEATLAAQVKTRRYAKRQVTWLRHQVLGNDPTINAYETQFSESILPEIFTNIRQNRLTALS